MRVEREGDGRRAGHRVERERVGVLEEEKPVHRELLDPFLHDPALSLTISQRSYAVEAEVDIAVAVGLAEKMAVRENGEMGFGVHDGGNDVLFQEEHLAFLHAEVVVLFQELESAGSQREETKGTARSLNRRS